jgi:hypothetical protein
VLAFLLPPPRDGSTNQKKTNGEGVGRHEENLWIAASGQVLVLGAAGCTIAQSAGAPQGWMMGSGMMGMKGGGMMNQRGPSGIMGVGMMEMIRVMSGQPLSPE